MTRTKKTIRVLLAALLPLALLLAGMYFYQQIFRPSAYRPPLTPVQNYDNAAMVSAMTPAAVSGTQEKILSFGSRFMGQPGFRQMEQFMRARYEEAGLEIHELQLQDVAPRTLTRSIAVIVPNADGAESDQVLDDAVIYPFLPNHLQPMVTPADGVRGKLLLLDPATLRTHTDFRGCIGLINTKSGAFDELYGFDWTKYAALGLQAIIVAHPDGFEQIPWVHVAASEGGMVSGASVNFVRVAATSGIFKYVGREIRLRVKTVYESVNHTMLAGVLRSDKPSKSALVIVSPYDACSILPDSAPGALQAVNPAVQLQLLTGLLHYQGKLERDVIFLTHGTSFTAESAINTLMGILYKNVNPTRKEIDAKAHTTFADKNAKRRLEPIRTLQEENTALLVTVAQAKQLLASPGFLETPAATQAAFEGVTEPTKRWVNEQFKYVLDSIALERQEPVTKARIKLEQAGGSVESPAFRAYRAAKRDSDAVDAVCGFSCLSLVERKKEFMTQLDVAGRLTQRIAQLETFHLVRQREIEQKIDYVKLFSRYDNLAICEPKVAPADTTNSEETISFTSFTKQMPSLAAILATATQKLGDAKVPRFVKPVDGNQIWVVYQQTFPAPTCLSPQMWGKFGYACYSFVNVGRATAYAKFADPVADPFMTDISTIQKSLLLLGESVLSMAFGNGRFDAEPFSEWADLSPHGRVLVSGVGKSVIPSYPLQQAIVSHRSVSADHLSTPGYFRNLLVMTDPYGKFSVPHDAADFTGTWFPSCPKPPFSPIAAGYDADGMICLMKDEGENIQRVFRSVNAQVSRETTLVMFRAAPVALFDLNNPQSLKNFSSIGFISKDGLSDLPKNCQFNVAGVAVAYFEPGKHFFVELKSGTPGNDFVQMTRAFILGNDAAFTSDLTREINGPGFLAGETSAIIDVPYAMASSMTQLNARRHELQKKYDMVDEVTSAYLEKSEAAQVKAGDATCSWRGRDSSARDATCYAILAHPILRDAIGEAVFGILWYLGLLIPFGFFAEKLLFCYSDIRKQLAAQTLIFFSVFICLRLLHPAFQMVRSSVMILLGFIILMISGGITILFLSKFGETIEEIRKKQGKIAAAEVNTFGVIGTAFMLGLNNMHRRKVRTWLTCATLTIITFVMICFTSLKNAVVDFSTATGKAPYQGFLVKKERFASLSQQECFAMKRKYRDTCVVAERRMAVGTVIADKKRNPQISLTMASSVDHPEIARKVELKSILQLSPQEPLRRGIDLLTTKGWFPTNDLSGEDAVQPVIISDATANLLGISPAQVNTKNILVAINGKDFRIHGIFKSAALEKIRDLDGLDLLPFDIERISDVKTAKTTGLLDVQEDDPRISAENIAIIPQGSQVSLTTPMLIASVAIALPDASHKEAGERIRAYMEQTGTTVCYGLDGISYRGRFGRNTSFSGMLDLFIPLLIAGLTVLNTMKGSVYERKDEIFVYNAVGIAPRYVFFIFFAEAFVYAVVGSVLGYLLSQGMGKLLTTLNMTGGMPMTFASSTTIYASLAIMAATFLSTYFPARTAMHISAPAEDAGWTLPAPVDDTLAFDLPFTFVSKARVAILSFFDRYLLDNSEGSSGKFQCGKPAIGVACEKRDAVDAPVPFIRTTVWLKPFDLGVSQIMTISLPHDPETGLYKGHIALDRISGSRDAWLRLNHGFVAQIRRQFLHWRAVTPKERDEMLEEARAMLAQLCRQEP